MIPTPALARLRSILAQVRSQPADEQDWNAAQILAAKQRVLARYQPIFAPSAIPALDRDTFLGFLKFQNNQHWSGLDRLGPDLTADMDRLRDALAILVDEQQPIRERLDTLRPPTGRPLVPRLGRAVITAVLHVSRPARYGVVNGTVEAGMKELGLWPLLPQFCELGVQYDAVNPILLELASSLETDLWTLDTLWWRLTLRGRPEFDRLDGEPSTRVDSTQRIDPVTRPESPPGPPPVRSLTLPSGLIIANPERRLINFCVKEYVYYDGIADAEPNRVTPIDILSTLMVNSRILDPKGGQPPVDSATIVRTLHRELAQACDHLLKSIPVDANILDDTPGLPGLSGLLQAAITVKNVGAAVATKVLHRKRRGFIPMLDSVIVKHYGQRTGRPQPGPYPSKQDLLAVALDAARLFREDLRACSSELDDLRLRLAKAGYLLSPVRVLEILIWTECEPNRYYRKP